MVVNNMKILYIDLDGVIVDFESGVKRLSREDRLKYIGRYDEAPGIFKLMKPISGAINAVKQLSNRFDVFVLSTAPWDNPMLGATRSNGLKKISVMTLAMCYTKS